MLVVTRPIITPAHHGGCAYPAGLLKQFASAGWTIDLLWLGAGDRPAPRADWHPPGASRMFVPGAMVLAGRAWSRNPRIWVKALFRRRTAMSARPDAIAPSDIAAVASLARRLRPEVCLVNHTRLAPVLAGRGPAAGWLLTHEVIHLRVESYHNAGLEPDFPTLEPAAESALWSMADRLIAISADDAAVMRACGRAVDVMPPAPPGPPIDPAQRVPGRVLFVGSANAANRDAAHWLLDAIWPRVCAAVPHATLDFAGYVCRDLPPPHPPGVRLLDHVDDLRAAYANASVVAVPVRAGAGLKLKLWEALHFGRPAVATPEGARGWPEWRTGILNVAGTADCFAAKLIELLDDPLAWEESWRKQRQWLSP